MHFLIRQNMKCQIPFDFAKQSTEALDNMIFSNVKF